MTELYENNLAALPEGLSLVRDENGLALVYRFAKWGYINTKGEEIWSAR